MVGDFLPCHTPLGMQCRNQLVDRGKRIGVFQPPANRFIGAILAMGVERAVAHTPQIERSGATKAIAQIVKHFRQR